MASCYWGWDTRGNRIAWGLVVTFVLIGAAFWIPGVVEVKKCINTYNACRCTATADGWKCWDEKFPNERTHLQQQCYEPYANCMRRPAAIWGVGWFFLIIMSWVPCCYFCCCSHNPKTTNGNLAYTPGVQMAPISAAAGMQPYAPHNAATGYPGNYPTTGSATTYPAATATYPTGPAQYPTYTQNAYDSNVPVHRY